MSTYAASIVLFRTEINRAGRPRRHAVRFGPFSSQNGSCNGTGQIRLKIVKKDPRQWGSP